MPDADDNPAPGDLFEDDCQNRPRQGRVLFRMASFRLSLLGMLLSSLGAIIAFALIYAAIDHTVHGAFRASIGDERRELLTEQRRNHWTLTEAVRAAVAESPGLFLSLRTGPLVGNIALPPASLGWHEFTRLGGIALPPGILAVDGLVMKTRGGTLFIGRDASWLITLNTRLAYVFGSVFSVMTGLGLLSSLLIALSSLQRVRAISTTSREIIAGDLSRRIKLYGRDDELDYLTDDLNAMLGQIEVLVENVRQVTNDVAHDLRSPLTRLRERLERAARDPLHPAACPAFEAALAQVDELISLFNALLRIAEIEASVTRLGFAQVNLTALIAELAEAFETVADDNGQSLRATIEPGLAIRGDRDLLAQMLTNLIENAIRHCPSGSAISLKAQASAGGIAITVADNGPGVPEADRARVLRRFVRLDAARHTPGNGLGLPLVAAVAALHDGSLNLSDNDPGLSIQIRLPA